jgi:hypothetical protein
MADDCWDIYIWLRGESTGVWRDGAREEERKKRSESDENAR